MDTVQSKNYKTWVAVMDGRTCLLCKKLNGKIYSVNETPYPEPPIHERGRCYIENLKAFYAGTATEKGTDGADWWLEKYASLPKYYITRDEAKKLGWKSALGNLNKVASGKMLMGGIYENKDGHLPEEDGRVWYEADINYTEGYRGIERIVFSNDGLVFVTYDHYETFYEII